MQAITLNGFKYDRSNVPALVFPEGLCFEEKVLKLLIEQKTNIAIEFNNVICSGGFGKRGERFGTECQTVSFAGMEESKAKEVCEYLLNILKQNTAVILCNHNRHLFLKRREL
jgi:hypothetical protein